MWRQRKEGKALEEGEMAGIGQDVRLVVEEDSMAEVEVVADVEQEQLSSQEPEEKPDQEPARPGTPSDLPDHTGGAGVTGGPSGSEFNSGNVKDHRATFVSGGTTVRVRVTWLRDVPSFNASHASRPKPHPDCCSSKSAAQEEEKDQEHE